MQSLHHSLAPCDWREAKAAASEADRQWFERHPRRHHRIRKPVPGEWSVGDVGPFHDPKFTVWTITRAWLPGVRMRRTLLWRGSDHPGKSEDRARAIWERCEGTGSAQ